MKPTILISKMGAVAYTSEFNKTRNASLSSAGEQGTTDAVVTHLIARGDLNIVYFGQWRGDIPEGMTYISSDVKGLNDLTTAKEQRTRWVNDLIRVTPHEPKAYITIAGYASGLSAIDNPRCSAVQTVAIRYTGPILNILQSCKLPRIVIVNDIRNYPKEGEMTHDWDWVRPQALLSQRDRDWGRVIYGKKWNIREIYSAAENWRKFPQLPKQQKVSPVTVIGHAHMRDGKRLKGYDAVWRIILSDVDELKQIGLRVYGKGWEHFSGYDPSYMGSLVTPSEVEQILASSLICPVTITGGELYTNKGRFCLAQRCLPLFYGNGGPYTNDPLGKYIPLDSDLRITKPGDLLRLVKYFLHNEPFRDRMINDLWRETSPNFSLLDDCVDDVLRGRDTSTNDWWEKYGGYRS